MTTTERINQIRTTLAFIANLKEIDWEVATEKYYLLKELEELEKRG